MKPNTPNEAEEMIATTYKPVNFKKTDYVKFRAKETEIMKKYGLNKSKKGDIK